MTEGSRREGDYNPETAVQPESGAQGARVRDVALSSRQRYARVFGILTARIAADLYLATAKQEKKGVVQRPGMSSLFNPAPKTVAAAAKVPAATLPARPTARTARTAGTTAACQIFQVLTST